MAHRTERLDRHVRVLFPPSLYERVEAVAEAEDRPAGAVIRRATRLYIEDAQRQSASRAGARRRTARSAR